MTTNERDFVFRTALAEDISSPAPDLEPIDLSALSLVELEPEPELQLTLDPISTDLAIVAEPSDLPVSHGGNPPLDLRGRSAPVALLELRRALFGREAGFEVLAAFDCPDIDADLAAAAKVAGLLIAAGDLAGTYRIKIRPS
jgi:hypothetical protein